LSAQLHISGSILQGGAISRSRAIIDIPAEVRPEGSYWIILGSNPPEVACSVLDRWWLTGSALPRMQEEITVRSNRLMIRLQLTPTANT
jgi:hypothetical protein